MKSSCDLLPLLLAASLGACSGQVLDLERADAADPLPDAGATEEPDARCEDAGTPDAEDGRPDAAGEPQADAQAPDAQPAPPDAAHLADAGARTDAGVFVDAGQPVDAGSPADGGSIASSDAGFYFAQDFAGAGLAGTSDTRTFTGWDLLGATTYLDDAYLWALVPSFTDARLDDTRDGGRRSLYFEMFGDDPSTSWKERVQMTMSFKAGVDLGVYHTSHRMFLSADLASLSQFPDVIGPSGSSWFVLFETWNTRNDAWDGDIAGSSRIGLGLLKDAGAGQAVHWTLTADYIQPSSIAYTHVWPRQTNLVNPPPFGQWFTLDLFMKRGEGSNGRFKVVLTPDGGAPVTLFDVQDSTIYPGHPELTVSSWQPFKFYFGDATIGWLKTNGKSVFAQYNDFKWHRD